ncbi:MAG: hypothetical protein U5L01_15990, partial [Rheinheimera sp.]|nr:hypothetical protein [Rheinheimera sp.]
PLSKTGVALLSKLFTKAFNTKTTTARERARDGAVDNSGPRRSRVEENPENQEAEALSDDLFETASEAGTIEAARSIGANGPQGLEGQPTIALVPPGRLDPALRPGALRIAAKAPPELRQAVLDELEGHLGLPRKSIANPLGWLHAVVEQALADTLTLTMAEGVAAARVHRRRHEAQQAAALRTAASASAAPDDPLLSTHKAEAQAKLRTLRDEMAAKARGRASSFRHEARGAARRRRRCVVTRSDVAGVLVRQIIAPGQADPVGHFVQLGRRGSIHSSTQAMNSITFFISLAHHLADYDDAVVLSLLVALDATEQPLRSLRLRSSVPSTSITRSAQAEWRATDSLVSRLGAHARVPQPLDQVHGRC